ncbi:GntR family transcriptional regulator [Bifidobacterium sp. MA2]|uniref:GntR family transcriptional regulator n=1 Tax=Bifidobacterium santillanense TaxID=2809028 RepID=A0ABS5UR03_9BIFI|nr:GntR family transcriptional regulator [Bifidobacterium santillanense]MBT1173377.1 GntR family transcriptional regulator [Bifidobacterium santillanense]
MKSHELAVAIAEAIDAKAFPDGKLPTENQLMQQYGVTRYCVRKAIAELVTQGRVYSVRGGGMYVHERFREGYVSVNVSGLSASFAPGDMTSRVLSIGLRDAGDEVAKRLKCDPGDRVYELLRLRSLKGEPMLLEHAFFLQSVVKYLDEHIAAGSIFKYLKESQDVAVRFVDKSFRADALPEGVARAMGLTPGEPTLVVEDEVYSMGGVVFDVSRSYYNYRLGKFFSMYDVS